MSDEERTIMKRHPVIGENICKPLHSLQLVLPIIRHHHEKGDGSGYPDGLKGKEIPVTAQVLQIVDVYDSLMTKRPYKPAFSQDKSFEILAQEVDQGWWDKDLFKEFRDMMTTEEWQNKFNSLLQATSQNKV